MILFHKLKPKRRCDLEKIFRDRWMFSQINPKKTKGRGEQVLALMTGWDAIFLKAKLKGMMTRWTISRDSATWIEKAHRFLQIQNETNAEYVKKKSRDPSRLQKQSFSLPFVTPMLINCHKLPKWSLLGWSFSSGSLLLFLSQKKQPSSTVRTRKKDPQFYPVSFLPSGTLT